MSLFHSKFSKSKLIKTLNLLQYLFLEKVIRVQMTMSKLIELELLETLR